MIKKIFPFIFLLFVCSKIWAKEDTLNYKYFGTVKVFYEKQPLKRVIVFLSAANGWNIESNTIAKSLIQDNNLVLGIDLKYYLKKQKNRKAKCFYPPGDIEGLSKYAQKKFKTKTYMLPTIVGLSEGATLAYSSLVQSPENTFIAAISINFSPEINLNKPLCKYFALNYTQDKSKKCTILPTNKISKNWIALQCDEKIDSNKTKDFVKETGKGFYYRFPKIGKEIYSSNSWNYSIDYILDKIYINKEELPKIGKPEIDDLPLIEVLSEKNNTNMMAVMISGDGGWSGLDIGVSELLSKNGIPVVGLNTLKYFWDEKTPNETSTDLKNILLFYLNKWKKERVVLIGYSFGAEVLPFMVNGLPENLKSRIELVTLIAPTKYAEFEFHFSSWINSSTDTNHPVLPQVQKFKGFKTLCIYSKDDNETDLCICLDKTKNKVIGLDGGHHFDSNYSSLVNEILKALK